MKSTGLVFAERPYSGLVTPTTYEDMSRYGHTCTITEATWFRLPSGLWILNFDGSNDKVDLGTSSVLDFGNLNTWTIIGWFRVEDVAGHNDVIFSEGNTTDNVPSVRMRHVSGALEGVHRNDANTATSAIISGAGTIAIATWYQGAYVRRAVNNYELYINALSVGTDTTSVDTTTIDNYSIGIWHRVADESPLLGDASLVRLLNYALSSEEIASKFQAERHWFGV